LFLAAQNGWGTEGDNRGCLGAVRQLLGLFFQGVGVHADGEGINEKSKTDDSPQSVTVSVIDAVHSDDPDINSINPERPNGSVNRIL
jgi:hypothetical protein